MVGCGQVSQNMLDFYQSSQAEPLGCQMDLAKLKRPFENWVTFRAVFADDSYYFDVLNLIRVGPIISRFFEYNKVTEFMNLKVHIIRLKKPPFKKQKLWKFCVKITKTSAVILFYRVALEANIKWKWDNEMKSFWSIWYVKLWLVSAF